jgi:hypothetical protein
MSPDQVSKLIADEIGADWGRSNLHGVDLRASLLAPERRLFSNGQDKSAREMWLVLEEKPRDGSGYKIVFDKAERKFGLAMPGRDGQDVFLGFYGTFLETFNGM